MKHERLPLPAQIANPFIRISECLFILLLISALPAAAQEDASGAQKEKMASGYPALITNTASRRSLSLNGKWHYIADPYETGFYDYRYKERAQNDAEAYWNSD